MSQGRMLRYFGSQAHTFAKASVRVVSTSLGIFVTLVVVWWSFCPMNVKRRWWERDDFPFFQHLEFVKVRGRDRRRISILIFFIIFCSSLPDINSFIIPCSSLPDINRFHHSLLFIIWRPHNVRLNTPYPFSNHSASVISTSHRALHTAN